MLTCLEGVMSRDMVGLNGWYGRERENRQLQMPNNKVRNALDDASLVVKVCLFGGRQEKRGRGWAFKVTGWWVKVAEH